DVIDPETGEVYLDSGGRFTNEVMDKILASKIKEVVFLKNPAEMLILNSINEDTTKTHDEALLKIYLRLRPGNPPQLEKAKELFKEKFENENKYRLGRVGRFRINRKFGLGLPETKQTLQEEDFISSIQYILKLRDPSSGAELDDIDHLGNRRIRTIDELAGDEFRKGFLKLKRTVQERMSLLEEQHLTPRSIINSKT